MNTAQLIELASVRAAKTRTCHDLGVCQTSGGETCDKVCRLAANKSQRARVAEARESESHWDKIAVFAAIGLAVMCTVFSLAALASYVVYRLAQP